MTILYFIDIVGTMVFAISGALTAYEKKMDVFGISAVAFITALGGGTLRDLLMGSTPVAWMAGPVYFIMIALGISIALIFKRRLQRLRKTFFLFDTIGIATFTMLGLQKALAIGMIPIVCIMMGMISAVFGGVIRDIVCNEIPLIFRKEVYALTCLFGGVVFFILRYFEVPTNWNLIISIVVIMGVRILAVRYNWSLPARRATD